MTPLGCECIYLFTLDFSIRTHRWVTKSGKNDERHDEWSRQREKHAIYESTYSNFCILDILRLSSRSFGLSYRGCFFNMLFTICSSFIVSCWFVSHRKLTMRSIHHFARQSVGKQNTSIHYTYTHPYTVHTSQIVSNDIIIIYKMYRTLLHEYIIIVMWTHSDFAHASNIPACIYQRSIWLLLLFIIVVRPCTYGLYAYFLINY